MKDGEKVTQSIRISPELWKNVKVHVAKTDTNISSFVEQALEEKLKKDK